MDETLIKFDGKHCNAMSCGAKNPIAGMLARQLLEGLNNSPLEVQNAQTVSSQQVANVAPREVGGAVLG